jgi:hypothetical protein
MYSCVICKKSYSKKDSLDKHKILCDFTSKSKQQQQIILEEYRDIPTYDQLVRIVQELSIKLQSMEEKINNMQKPKVKTSNIIEWLNTKRPSKCFLEWINNSIEITKQQCKVFIEKSTTIYNIIQEILEYNIKMDDNEIYSYPIIGFIERKNVLYIYDIEDDGIGNWTIMELDKLFLLVKKIINAIIKVMRSNKSFIINTNDSMTDLYNKTIIKLMDIHHNDESKLHHIQNNLYNYLKTSYLTNVTSYK